MAKVVIVGLGNLGSRHLQGLSLSKNELEIGLIDPSPASIATARKRWAEVVGPDTPHRLLDGHLPNYDVAIIATTADHRCTAVKALKAKAEIGAWVLEKPLAQSLRSLDQLTSLISAPAWVNLPRRVIPWHLEIAKAIRAQDAPLEISISGGAWGMVCNAIHFIDLARIWTNSEPVSIDVSGLDQQWHASKRTGYSEAFGHMDIAFMGGSSLRLESAPTKDPHVVVANNGDTEFTLAEGAGKFSGQGGVEIDGAMAYQSALTGSIVDKIVNGEEPGLPTLASISSVERLLLTALIPHREADGGPIGRLDIT